MSENGLSNPSVQVNGISYAIIPNSLKYKRGKGNVNVRSQSAGGDSISTVVTENAETKISMVSFILIPTDANIKTIAKWQENRFNGGNTIRFSEKGSRTPLSFTGMNITNDPEYAVGADGKVSVEFMGNPA